MSKRPVMKLLATTVAATCIVAVGRPAWAASADVPAAPTVTTKVSPIIVGDPVKFVFRVPPRSALPTAFEYALDNQAPVQVPADDGRAVVKIRTLLFTNILVVTAVGADGARSPQTTYSYNANPAPVAFDQDHNGDGRPDFLFAGNQAGFASGLWQALGRGSRGAVRLPVTTVAPNGVYGDAGQEAYDGAQVITGKFLGGSFEDFGLYNPSGPHAGVFAVLNGTGDGSPIPPYSPFIHLLVGDALADANGNNPLQVVNAYDTSGNHYAYPDLLATIGDPVNGYSLDLYSNQNGPNNYAFPVDLAQPTPTGGFDWNHWRLATKLVAGAPAVALWNETTGDLYLWEGLSYNADTGRLGFTQYRLSSSWYAGVDLAALQLTDVNADGVPDLWALDQAGELTAYLVSNLSTTGTATLTAQPSQQLP
jgi:hypothetical protein